MDFLRYILLLSAPQKVMIASYIFIGVALIFGIYFAVKEKIWFLAPLLPVMAWLIMLLFYFLYDKLNLAFIFIP